MFEKIQAFEIGQPVLIIPAGNHPAVVQAILVTAEGLQYQISYWHENTRRVEWVFPPELRRASK